MTDPTSSAQEPLASAANPEVSKLKQLTTALKPYVSARLVVFGLLALLSLYGTFYLMGSWPMPKDHCRVTDVLAVSLKCSAMNAAGNPVPHVLKAVDKDEDDKKRLAQIKVGAIFPVSQFIPLTQAEVAACKDLPPGASCRPAPTISALKEATAKPNGWATPFALAGTALFLWVSVGCSRKVFSALFMGADHKLSTSKTQSVMWLQPVLGFWHYFVMARYTSGMPWADALQVTISTELLALAGLSAATAATAKVAATVVKDKPEAAVTACRDWTKVIADLKFLFCNDDGKLDAADTQMIVITAISVLSFILASVDLVGKLSLTGQAEMAAPPELMKFLLGGSLSAYLAPKLGDVLAKLKSG